jgi:hypothetical protein
VLSALDPERARADFYGLWRGRQGLTLVHNSAQVKRILWDMGASRGYSGVFRRCQGVLRSIRGCSGCTLCEKWTSVSPWATSIMAVNVMGCVM